MSHDHAFRGGSRPGVGDSVELVDVTGDWGPGVTCRVLRVLRTHALVTVLDQDGRQIETVPVGYESVRPTDPRRPPAAPRRRPLVA